MHNLGDPGTQVGTEFIEITDRAFKQLSKDLLEAGYPCFSCERGYYAGQDAADLLDFRRYVLKLARPTLNNGRLARWAMEAQARRMAGELIPVQRVMGRILA